MSTFTCNSCALQFRIGNDQREHMKSDWHRYNLKRRVANLPPIDEFNFKSKVQSAEAAGSPAPKNEAHKKDSKKKQREALLEKKRQLLELQKQRNALASAATTSTVEEPVVNDSTKPEDDDQKKKPEENEDEEAEMTPEELAERLMQQKIANKVDIPKETCLFCHPSKTFTTFHDNLDHMLKSHGFFIPEQKYLVDKEGLVAYLSEKIGLGNICLVCSFQGRSLESIRAHMLSKRHCKIPYESENEKLEISDFYDFTSTYAKPVVISAEDAADDEDGDEWEDVESGEDEDEDDEAPIEYLYHDGTELYLPNGSKIGHRSLQRMYKQKLRPERILTEGQGTLVAADTRSFLSLVDRDAVEVQKRAWKHEVHDKKRDDKRAAKFVNNQPYYRDQLLQ